MASFRIAGLMAPPSIAPLPPFRPSGGAFGPLAADVPAPHCAISDRVAAREGFYGCLPGAAIRDGDLLPGQRIGVPSGGWGAVDDLRACTTLRACYGGSIRPSRSAPHAA